MLRLGGADGGLDLRQHRRRKQCAGARRGTEQVPEHACELVHHQLPDAPPPPKPPPPPPKPPPPKPPPPPPPKPNPPSWSPPSCCVEHESDAGWVVPNPM